MDHGCHPHPCRTRGCGAQLGSQKQSGSLWHDVACYNCCAMSWCLGVERTEEAGAIISERTGAISDVDGTSEELLTYNCWWWSVPGL